MTKENLPQATKLQPLPTLRVWARQAGFSEVVGGTEALRTGGEDVVFFGETTA